MKSEIDSLIFFATSLPKNIEYQRKMELVPWVSTDPLLTIADSFTEVIILFTTSTFDNMFELVPLTSHSLTLVSMPLVLTRILGFGGKGAAKLKVALQHVLGIILVISIPSSSLALPFLLFTSLTSFLLGH